MLSRKNDELSRLTLRLQNLEQAQEDLTEELNDTKLKNDELRVTSESLRKENISLRAQLRLDPRLSTSFSTSFIEPEPSTPSADKVPVLQDQLRKAKATEERLEALNFELEGRVEYLEKELEVYQEQGREGRVEIKRLDVVLCRLQCELEKAEEENASKSQAITSLTNHCAELKQMLEAKARSPQSAESSFSFYTDSSLNNPAQTSNLPPESELSISETLTELNAIILYFTVVIILQYLQLSHFYAYACFFPFRLGFSRD